jgi:hypothetical protein
MKAKEAKEKTEEVLNNTELARIFNTIDEQINDGQFNVEITKKFCSSYSADQLRGLGYFVTDVDHTERYHISWLGATG